ncbi:MAG: hypothetical protein GXY52_05095 [Chloroflexi bacterium]|nr:hypothetical protein [Chloroflexota bacterium]
MSFEPVKPDRITWTGILPFVLMFLSGAVAVPILLGSRTLLGKLSAMAGINRWTYGVIDKLGFILLAIAWLAFTIWSQHYYDTAPDLRTTLRRFGRVMIVLVLVLVALAFAL